MADFPVGGLIGSLGQRVAPTLLIWYSKYTKRNGRVSGEGA